MVSWMENTENYKIEEDSLPLAARFPSGRPPFAVTGRLSSEPYNLDSSYKMKD